MHCELVAVSGRKLDFVLDSQNASLFQERQVGTLGLAFAQVLGEPVEITMKVGEVGELTPHYRRKLMAAERQKLAEEALNEDPQLAALLAEFDGQLVEGSIRPQ